METKRSTNRIMKVMEVLTWIAFIALCIRTWSLLYSFVVSVSFNSIAAKDLYMGLDLSELQALNVPHYSVMVLLIIVQSALTAYMFYQVIKIFKTINLTLPFSENMASLITSISRVALAIGIVSVVGIIYWKWLISEGLKLHTALPDLEGGVDYLYFAGIVFIISMVFSRGIEIQSENDLTV